jgi:hypothetical protein
MGSKPDEIEGEFLQGYGQFEADYQFYACFQNVILKIVLDLACLIR